VRARSYHDRVDHDASNRSFFLYNLSRYNNRRHYVYGQTDDLHMTELAISKRVPVYTMMYNNALEDHDLRAVELFEKFIEPYKCDFPMLPTYDVFTLDDATYDINDVLSVLHALFPSSVGEDGIRQT
jgi:hypothetical protein